MHAKHIAKTSFAVLALLIFFSEARGQLASWQTFSSVGFSPRYATTAVTVNGKIYVIGGEGYTGSANTGGLLDSIEAYDPHTDSWEAVQTPNNFPTLFSPSSVQKDGKIYIIGGVEDYVDASDSIWIFDPVVNSWSTAHLSETSGPFIDRYGLASSVIGDSIYAIGGSLTSGPAYWISPVQVFDTKTNSWSTPEVTNDSFHIVISPKSCVIAGKIYVVGQPLDTTCHCEVQVYDPQTNVWSYPSTSWMSIPRAYFAMEEIEGKIYVMGGQDWYHGGVPTNVTEVYDPVLRTWSVLPVTGKFTARDDLSSSSIGNKIYTFGGEQGLGIVNTTEVLTLGSNGVESSSDGKLYYNQRIFPNPASTTLNLASVEASTRYRIIDILGRIVMSGMTLDHATLTIDISSLPRGAYYVFVERADEKGVFVIAGKAAVIDR